MNNKIMALGECLYIDGKTFCPEKLLDMDVNKDRDLIALLGHDNIYIYNLSMKLLSSISLNSDLGLLKANRIALGARELAVCGEDNKGPLVLLMDPNTLNIISKVRANCADIIIRGNKVHIVNMDAPEDFSLDYTVKLDVLNNSKDNLDTVFQKSSEDLWEAKLKIDWGQTILGFDGVVRIEDGMQFPGRFGLPLPNKEVLTFSMDYMLLYSPKGELICKEKVGWVCDAEWKSNMLLLGGSEGIKLIHFKPEELGIGTPKHIHKGRGVRAV